MKNQKQVNNPSFRNDGYVHAKTPVGKDKYVYYKHVKKVVYADPEDKTSEVIGIKDTLVVEREVPIQEQINSYANEVGPKAIVKRMNDGVDVSDLLKKPSLNDGVDGIVDARSLNLDGGETYDRMAQASALFAQLDPALKGEAKDINAFLACMDQEKLDAYIKARVDALYPQKEEVKE